MHGDSKLTGLSIQFTIKKQLNLSHKRIEDGDGNQQLEPSKSLSKKLNFMKLYRL